MSIISVGSVAFGRGHVGNEGGWLRLLEEYLMARTSKGLEGDTPLKEECLPHVLVRGRGHLPTARDQAV